MSESPVFCPTCGRPVEVVSGDEGTSYFRPVAEEVCVSLCAGLARHLEDAQKARDGWADFYREEQRAARRFETALREIASYGMGGLDHLDTTAAEMVRIARKAIEDEKERTT